MTLSCRNHSSRAAAPGPSLPVRCAPACLSLPREASMDAAALRSICAQPRHGVSSSAEARRHESSRGYRFLDRGSWTASSLAGLPGPQFLGRSSWTGSSCARQFLGKQFLDHKGPTPCSACRRARAVPLPRTNGQIGAGYPPERLRGAGGAPGGAAAPSGILLTSSVTSSLVQELWPKNRRRRNRGPGTAVPGPQCMSRPACAIRSQWRSSRSLGRNAGGAPLAWQRRWGS